MAWYGMIGGSDNQTGGLLVWVMELFKLQGAI